MIEQFIDIVGILSLSIILINVYKYSMSYLKHKSFPKNEKDFEIDYLNNKITLLENKIEEQKKEIDQMVKLIYNSQE